jgi:hypothetical protein
MRFAHSARERAKTALGRRSVSKTKDGIVENEGTYNGDTFYIT